MSKTQIPTGGIADDAISEEHIDATVITGSTALAATPADTDEFLISDAGTIKRIDYSLIKGGNTPIFSVRQDGSHNVADNNDTKILWDAELVDSDSAFASDKFTVPTGADGTYFLYVMAHGRSDSNSDLNVFYLSIYKNGSRIAMNEFDARANPLRKINTTCLTIQSLSADDYIEGYLKVDIGSGTPSYAGDDFQMMFGGFKIG
tara:strand:- start:1088 stop:1699 length:612 start_codon:yes stop_codon:yes gene_type:complete